MNDFGQEQSPMTNIFYLILMIISTVSYWKIYTKMGIAGWKSIIPIYSAVVLFNALGRSGWQILLFLIPFVNIYIAFKVYIELAKRFDKGAGFGVGLVLLGFIFAPILAFSDAQYKGNKAHTVSPTLDL